jgi:hypothetical protein
MGALSFHLESGSFTSTRCLSRSFDIFSNALSYDAKKYYKTNQE